MRVLEIAVEFPPQNSIGAVRTGKVASYLQEFGHEVRVITNSGDSDCGGLSVGISEEDISRVPGVSAKAPSDFLRHTFLKEGSNRLMHRCLRNLVYLYEDFACFPDRYNGWIPSAYHKGKQLIEEWEPDVIYASAYPYSCLLVGGMLSRRTGLNYVAEFRDLWVDDSDYVYRHLYPRGRAFIERKLERFAIQPADHLITMSEIMANQLRQHYDKSISVIMNGFDPSDFPEEVSRDTDGPLKLVYTGSVRLGRRDPTRVMEAISRLSNEYQSKIELDIYGKIVKDEKHTELTIPEELSEIVSYKGFVAHRECLKIQREADVLLLLLDNEPKQSSETTHQGIHTGKLFEYLGARRPILGIGTPANEAMRLIRNQNAGAVAHKIDDIAEQLKTWVDQKQQGKLEDFQDSLPDKFKRRHQVKQLEQILSEY